jgi:AAA ATPase containing von Willebrand factor type A (vWA) domain
MVMRFHWGLGVGHVYACQEPSDTRGMSKATGLDAPNPDTSSSNNDIIDAPDIGEEQRHSDDALESEFQTPVSSTNSRGQVEEHFEGDSESGGDSDEESESDEDMGENSDADRDDDWDDIDETYGDEPDDEN